MVWSGSIVEVAPIGAPHSSQNVANLLLGVRQETQVIVSSLLVISFLLATVCPQHFTKVAMIDAKPYQSNPGPRRDIALAIFSAATAHARAV